MHFTPKSPPKQKPITWSYKNIPSGWSRCVCTHKAKQVVMWLDKFIVASVWAYAYDTRPCFHAFQELATRKVGSGCRRPSPCKAPRGAHDSCSCSRVITACSALSEVSTPQTGGVELLVLYTSSVLGKKRKTDLDTTIFRASTKTLFGPQISLSSFLPLSVHMVSLKHREHVWPHFLRCASNFTY